MIVTLNNLVNQREQVGEDFLTGVRKDKNDPNSGRFDELLKSDAADSSCKNETAPVEYSNEETGKMNETVDQYEVKNNYQEKQAGANTESGKDVKHDKQAAFENGMNKECDDGKVSLRVTASKTEKGISLKNGHEVVVDLKKLPGKISIQIENKLKAHDKGLITADKLKKELSELLSSYFKNDPEMQKVASEMKDAKLTVKGRGKETQTGKSVKSDSKELKGSDLKDQMIFTNVLPVENKDSKSESPDKTALDSVKPLENGKSVVNKRKSAANEERVSVDSLAGKESKIEKVADQGFSSKLTTEDKIRDTAKVFNETKTESFDQIAKQTKMVLSNGEMKFSTFVRPDEIGRVDFKFDVKDGKISGKIILQTKEAADLFRSNVEDLRAVFQKSNVELDKLEITVAGRNDTFSMGAGGGDTGRDGEGSREYFLNTASQAFEDNMNGVEDLDFFNEKGINIVA